MGFFSKKTWKDRLTQFPNRRKLTDTTTGTEQVVDVTRVEGEVGEAGDGFTEENMNGLETRIDNAFKAVKPEALGGGYGACTTAAATVAKEAVLSGYDLVVNGRVSIVFTNAVPANATLNINGKGAKPIYNNGSAITANVIQAGMIATFIYDGNNYVFIPAGDPNAMVKGVDYVTAGKKPNTTLGANATAEGVQNRATGNYSHAEGYGNLSSGESGHTEGLSTTASAGHTHAEGAYTTASASEAHAEGWHTIASHNYSHAEGNYTKTGAQNQHVQGTYNVGKSTTLFEIGKGTADNARANAFEVSASGDVVAAGTITDGSGNKVGKTGQILKLRSLSADSIQKTFNGSIERSVIFEQTKHTLEVADWSSSANAAGYYTCSITISDMGSEQILGGRKPRMFCAGADDDNAWEGELPPTVTDIAAYRSIEPPNGYVTCEESLDPVDEDFYYNRHLYFYTKKKPTAPVYVLVEWELID